MKCQLEIGASGYWERKVDDCVDVSYTLTKISVRYIKVQMMLPLKISERSLDAISGTSTTSKRDVSWTVESA